MSAPTNSWQSALEFIWGQYRVWTATSRAYKARLSRWRRVVSILGSAGAVFGVLSAQQWIQWDRLWPPLPGALGVTGAVLLALAAYFSKEILSFDCEGRWIRARAAAEALKREAYLLLARVPPYDGVISLGRVSEITRAVDGLEYERLTPEQKRAGLPAAPLTVDDYLRVRVEGQVNNFYEPKAAENRAVARRIRTVSMALGALAVILSGLGYVWVGIPAFAAVVTTITTALAASLYAGRYQYLVVSYMATARKLEELRVAWQVSGKTDADTAERNRLILDCEGVFATENGAWMAEWTKPAGQSSPAAVK